VLNKEREKNEELISGAPGRENHQEECNTKTSRQEVGDGEFSASYRIYYEDTDAGGVVYYANYLKFFERARTDFLRSKNIVQSKLAEETGVVFVVRDCCVKYLKPARMDDLVDVSVKIVEVGKLSLKMEQEISSKGMVLNRMEVEIVCVNADNFRPTRIPNIVLDKMGIIR
jgi:acyl-CoA thioester hydrolase